MSESPKKSIVKTKTSFKTVAPLIWAVMKGASVGLAIYLSIKYIINS